MDQRVEDSVMPLNPPMSRRRLLIEGTIACAAATLPVPASARTAGALAAATGNALAPTPSQTEGPFYPLTLPLDSDNDLVQVAGRGGAAKGVVTHVGGRILDPAGRPIADARVEIWQCDANGRYHYVHDEGEGGGGDRRVPLDENFQGYGRTVTDGSGMYRFRTIRPVPYPGRTPHIHFAVSGRGFDRFVTQMYVAGEPGNARDFVLMSVRDPAARTRLIVPLAPAPGPEQNALAGTFDIVLGQLA
jgi:protocatechuate 3,4-dioxygenase, beta subunit